jgi:hypothetical protein
VFYALWKGWTPEQVDALPVSFVQELQARAEAEVEIEEAKEAAKKAQEAKDAADPVRRGQEARAKGKAAQQRILGGKDW